jgi:hypothetical protein
LSKHDVTASDAPVANRVDPNAHTVPDRRRHAVSGCPEPDSASALHGEPNQLGQFIALRFDCAERRRLRRRTDFVFRLPERC